VTPAGPERRAKGYLMNNLRPLTHLEKPASTFPDELSLEGPAGPAQKSLQVNGYSWSISGSPGAGSHINRDIILESLWK
jgi:hypothetical protein